VVVFAVYNFFKPKMPYRKKIAYAQRAGIALRVASDAPTRHHAPAHSTARLGRSARWSLSGSNLWTLLKQNNLSYF
jgi:hypothetical protein